MRYIAFLRSRDLFIMNENGREMLNDFLYYTGDRVTADRVMLMYGYARIDSWRDHPRIPGVLVCEVKREERKVK